MLHMTTSRKKICFIITAQNQYARSKLLLRELQSRHDVELSIVVGGSAILGHYGDVLALLARDGFTCTARIEMVVEGSTLTAMAKTVGLATIEFTNIFDRIRPDIVVVRGDRYEVLAAAIAASYLNVPVAHLEGGDVTGTLDESVRHAITKLAHIHFVTNDAAYHRVIRMGEPQDRVFNVGAPEVEFAAKIKGDISSDAINRIGVGDEIDLTQPFLMVMYHPVTTEYGDNGAHTHALLQSIVDVGMPTLWFWPNIDAGSDEMSKAIRMFRERDMSGVCIRFLKALSAEDFIALLGRTSCLIGNSSAGIKEASYLGTPVVNIGTRQNGRLRSENVLDVPRCVRASISRAIRRQVGHGRYPQSLVYFKKGSGKRIASILARVRLTAQKQFVD